MRIRITAFRTGWACLSVLCGSPLHAAEERFPNLAAQGLLPHGAGLASQFSADSGIATHPAVIFADDFETGDLGARWDEKGAGKGKALSLAPSNGEVCGRRCLKVEARLGENQGDGLTKWFEPAQQIFVRFYVKFDPGCDYVHHFVTLRANKGLRGGDKWSGFGGAGLRPNGDERFSTALEPWGNWARWPAPGKWNFYSYWHEMLASPDGKYWGNSFLTEAQEVIQKDRWICAEFMLKHNTPGQPDGEQAFWIDGRLMGHWRGINWRKSASLQANALTLESYVTDRWTKNPTNTVYFDNLVIARDYIGPAGSGSALRVPRPRLAGAWWQIAGNPDLGALTTTNQQPVDFGLWRAADGTWQLWSCIRNTKEPGVTRLFHRWEGRSLFDTNWTPRGIAMHADPSCGEKPGGLQAPFVFRDGDRFVMFYGGWDNICSASSREGKRFERSLDGNGKATLFGEPFPNPRDPMVLRIGDTWHCYYTAHPNDHGAVYCRTSRDLRHWGSFHLVAKGGQAKDGPYAAECPFVVELDPGRFYLFRTQRYGADAQTSVYFSRNPLDFGLDGDEEHFVCTLPVAAPEVLRFEGEWLLAALLPGLNGIQVSRLAWE